MDRKNPGIKDYLRWLLNKKSGKPLYAGEVVAGVKGAVKIYYDDFGIPHIYAESEYDLFFAQGFVHANDRLFQMDILRRYASGRMAEIVGKRMADADILQRTIGLRRAAELNLTYYSQETVSVLEAYADGVNAFMEKSLRENNLPPEFLLLDYRPHAWTVVDSICISKLIALRTGGNMSTELLFFAAARELDDDKERLRELLPVYPEYGPSFIGSAMGNKDIEGAARIIEAAQSGGDGKFPGGASNNWVVSGEHTASGYPLFASDMHLPLDLPNIFMASHLVVPGLYKVNGLMFPGLPGIISGFNEHIAWSETTLPADTMDLYEIRFSDKNPEQYLYDDKWIEADFLKENILVRGGDDIELEVAVTCHGPVISGAMGMETPLALRWVEIAPDIMERNRGMEAMLKMIKSTNFKEFREALQNFSSPPHNFIYADVKGNIGLLANGLFPVRSAAHREAGNGLFPVPGWKSEYNWTGFVPWEEIPAIYNPPTGIIVSANHKVVEDDYPHFISYEWHHPARAISILRSLKGKKKLRADDMVPIQNMFYNSQAEILAPVMTESLYRKETELSGTEEKALAVLSRWGKNPEDGPDSAGAAIFYHTYAFLMHNIYLDRVSDNLRKMLSGYRNLYITVEKTLLKGESSWTSDLDEEILVAFCRAVKNLGAYMGKEPARWRWGYVHRITLKHHLGDDVSKRTYNRGPFFVGGSSVTPCMLEFHMEKKLPYNVYMGAPHRFILDLDGLRGREAMTAGNSGHTASPHYDDMIKLWLRGKYKKVLFDDKEIKKLKNVLTLSPSR